MSSLLKIIAAAILCVIVSKSAVVAYRHVNPWCGALVTDTTRAETIQYGWLTQNLVSGYMFDPLGDGAPQRFEDLMNIVYFPKAAQCPPAHLDQGS